jgi:hypothetical protein
MMKSRRFLRQNVLAVVDVEVVVEVKVDLQLQKIIQNKKQK